MEPFNKETKDPNRDDIPSGLLRQRRNLFIISLVLLFVYYSGVKIETASLSVFGAALTLDSPQVFDDFQILWVTWAYFLIRYTQYIKFYGVMSDIWAEYYGYLEPLLTHFFLGPLSEKLVEHFVGNPVVHPRNVKFSLANRFQYISAGFIGKDYSNSVHVEKMGFFLTLFCKFRAFIRLLTTSRHVTDYWLPYCLAMIPFGYSFFTSP